jgi:uncharacterized membrane protein YfcA
VASTQDLRVAVALFVMAIAIVSGLAPAVPVSPFTQLTAGIVSGVTGTTAGIGGPPIALLYQRTEPRVARATMSVFFFVGVILSLVGLAVSGSLGREPSLLALALAPGVVVGYVVGRRTRGMVDQGVFRWAVLVVCTLSALALLARSCG